MDLGNLLKSVISNVDKKAKEFFPPSPTPVNHNPLGNNVVKDIENFGGNLFNSANKMVGGVVNDYLHPSYSKPPKTITSTPIKQLQMPQVQDHGAIGNYFDPNHASQDRFNFWNTQAAKALAGFQQFSAHPPKLNLEQYTDKIDNPLVKFPAQIATGFVDSMVNTPQNLLIAGNRIGTDVRTGKIYEPRTAIGDTAAVLDPLLNIYTLGGASIAKGIGKQAVKDIGEQGLKSIAENQLKLGSVNSLKDVMVKGGLQGAKWGSIFGGLQGLSEGDKADFKNGLIGMTQGGLLGGALGAGTAGIGGFYGKLGRIYKKFGLEGKEKRNELINFTKRMGQPRDSRGRFSEKQPTFVVNYRGKTWSEVNKTLGRPENTPVSPEDFDRATNIELGIPEDFDIPHMGLSIKEVDSRKLGINSLHALNRNQGRINRNANFTETDGIESVLRNTLNTAKDADDEVRLVSNFVDNEIANANGNSLKAARAALNRELEGLIGVQGNYKRNFAALNVLRDDPLIGPRINAIEDGIIKIDDVLKKVPLSSDASKTKQGKIKVTNLPTQTEIKNRAEVNYGNPDLYDQRKIKIKQALDTNPEPLPWESSDQRLVQGYENSKLSTNLEQNKMPLTNIGTHQRSSLEQDILKSTEKLPPLTDSQGQKVDTSLDGIIKNSGFDVKKKIGLLDYARTPDRVLNKIGLGREAKELRGAYDNYIKELPQEIDKVTQWSKQVPKEENQALFKYLDGQTKINSLSPQTRKIARQIKKYLGQWADRLDLPEDARITNYITHIFDKEKFTKEIDPDLAKIIRDKVAGSVYDPFTEKRLGALGYKEDTWAALDAYVKRATRKANMDPILNTISQKSDNLEESQFNYVKNYIAGVNMQPTKIDNLIDNTIKQVVGYKFGARPTAYLTRMMRQAGFRGTLGLNVGSALRNLTQGVNTYAKLGEVNTLKGYTGLVKSIVNKSDELEREGVLRNDFVQDRTISVTKQLVQKMDKGLFALFEAAEKINRGSAYFGAKAKALSEGKSELQAIQYAKDFVRDTQFTFGQVDTPAILRSDLAKTLGQFQSYNIKQGEFVAGMVKNKEFKSLARYIVGNMALVGTIGSLFGMKPTDMIPFWGVASGQTKLGQTPAINAAGQLINAINPNAEDKYGNRLTLNDRVDSVVNAGIPLIPGGVQMKKTAQGLQSYLQGYTSNASGKVQVPIEKTPTNLIRGVLFGKNYLPGMQDYYNSGQQPLSESQSSAFKNGGGVDLYNQIMQARGESKREAQIKDNLKGGSQVSGDKIYYNSNGTVKTFDLTPNTKGTEGTIGAISNSDWKQNQAAKLWNTEGIPEETKIAVLNKWGIDPQDARYAGLTQYSSDISAQYIASKSQTHEDLLRNIITGRVVGITGEQFADNSAINKLKEQGLLSDSEASILKRVKVDKKGNNLNTSSGSKKSKTPTFEPMKIGSKNMNSDIFKQIASLQAPKLTVKNIKFNVPNIQPAQGKIDAPNFASHVKFNL